MKLTEIQKEVLKYLQNGGIIEEARHTDKIFYINYSHMIGVKILMSMVKKGVLFHEMSYVDDMLKYTPNKFTLTEKGKNIKL